VPRFYFDTEDTGACRRDTVGTELANLEDARKEALETLGGIARDELPDGNDREFVIHVRLGRKRLLTATLSLRVETHG
jgi:hypothetical protein